MGPSMRPSLIVIFLVFIFSFSAGSTLINRTINDSDLDKIRYVPSTRWQLESGNSTCSECLLPDLNLTLRQTVHYGLHSAPPSNADEEQLAKVHGDDDDHADSGPGKTDNTPTTDALGFRDVNVMASLNFTGSAIYVYCVLPTQNYNPAILSTTNLTFLLDGLHAGSFIHVPHEGSHSSTDFRYQVPVFFKNNLPQAQHTLVVKAELGSIILLDYIEYSTLDTDSSRSSISTPLQILAQRSGSEGGGDDKKNKATFGIAIGCTVGVLTLVALGVCISLYRRRRRSAQLQRRLDAEEAARTSDRGMHGPEPFIPRYFPGTVHPLDSSPPRSPFVQTHDDVEELGPSHGLDLPTAPEHAGGTVYSMSLISGHPSGRTASTLMDVDDVPPHYQYTDRSLPVAIAVTYPPPPPPPPPSLLYPYALTSASVEDSVTSSSNLHVSLRHSNSDPARAASPLSDEPPTPTDNDYR